MNITELLLTLLITFSIGKISEYQSPRYYDLETVGGNVYNIKIEKKSKYACPLYCKADHYHHVIIVEDKMNLTSDFYNLFGFGSDNVYINSYEVANLEEVKTHDDKKRTKLKTLDVQTYLP